MKLLLFVLTVFALQNTSVAQVKKKKTPTKTKVVKYALPKIVKEEETEAVKMVDEAVSGEKNQEGTIESATSDYTVPTERSNGSVNESRSTKSRTPFGKTGKFYLETQSKPGSYYENYYGMTDINNKIILPTAFAAITEIEDGTGENILQLGNLYALTDQNFNVLLPMEYASIQSLGINDLYLVSVGSDYYNKKIVDKKGVSLLDENKYTITTLYYSNRSNAMDRNRYVRVQDKTNFKYAIYDISKKVFATAFVYDEISDSESGLTVKKNMGFNFLNDEFKEVMPKLYSSIQVANKGLFIVNDNGKFGLVNIEGNFIAPVEYKSIQYLYSPMSLFILTKDGEASIIDAKGKVIFNNDYQTIQLVGENNFAVKKNNKWGVVNILQSELMPIKYDTVIVNYKNIIAKDKKIYIMNISNGIVKETEYTNIERFNYDYYKVYNGNKVGLLNEYFDVILPIEFDEIASSYDYEYTFTVKKAEKYGTYSKNGKLIVPIQFDKISKIGDLYALLVKQNGKYGLLNNYGQQIEPCEYDFIGTDRQNEKTIICIKGTTFKKVKVGSKY